MRRIGEVPGVRGAVVGERDSRDDACVHHEAHARLRERAQVRHARVLGPAAGADPAARPCVFAGYPACVSDDCRLGLRPCPSPAEWGRLRAIEARRRERQTEAASETRNLFQLLLAKGSITVAHRQPPSLLRRLWLALT